MSRLTVEERRRVFLSQEQARRMMMARLGSAPVAARAVAAPGRHVRWLVTMLTIIAALGCGLVASQAIEFHPPTSIIEALLPRI